MTAAQAHSELSFPMPGPPGQGEAAAVAPGIYWVRLPLPFQLDHVNVWLLRDGDGWTIVDTGLAWAPARAQWEQVLAATLGGRPVSRVLATHFHPDHLGLAAWLCERFQAPLWITPAEHQFAQLVLATANAETDAARRVFYRRHGLDAQRSATLPDLGRDYRKGVQAPPAHCVPLEHGDRLHVDGRDWAVIVAGGHAPAHACLYCPELDLLISGDQVLPRITPNVSVWHSQPEAEPLGAFFASLGQFEALPAETLVLPSHGLVFRGLGARVAQMRAHHEERLAAVVAACTVPRSAADLLPLLFPARLDPHSLIFALGETIAHLHHPWRQGVLERDVDAAGVMRFVARDAG